MATSTASTPARRARSNPTPIKYYLIAYNALTLLAWFVVLFTTLEFLFTSRSAGQTHSNAAGSLSKGDTGTAKAKVLGWFSAASDAVHAYTKTATSSSGAITGKPFAGSYTLASSYPSYFPVPLTSLFTSFFTQLNRLSAHFSGAYGYRSPFLIKTFGDGLAPKLGPWTVLTQTGAVLEVVHSLLGWVRSDPLTVAMQVSSRLWMVWGIVERCTETHNHPLFTSMILAWSVTEVIRCGFYLTSLLEMSSDSVVVKGLTWLRYNTFYLLYPLGASSEAFLMSSTLPSVRGLPRSVGAQLRRKKGILGGMKFPGGKGMKWDMGDLAVGGLFLGWWPALYVLFSHMLKLRAKVFGKGRKLGAGKKVQ